MNKHNPVAKHAHKYNKDMVHEDRKQREKRGYTKHKKPANTETF